MVIFVLRKLILQTCWFLVGPFVYFHTSCVRTAKALARLRGCAGSHEPSLVAYELAQLISPGSATKILIDMPRMTTCETMAIFYSFIDGLYKQVRLLLNWTIWATSWENLSYAICEQQRGRSMVEQTVDRAVEVWNLNPASVVEQRVCLLQLKEDLL